MSEPFTMPKIEGERIHLRGVEASDLEAYYNFLLDEEMGRLTGSQEKSLASKLRTGFVRLVFQLRIV
ncbi:GNAT family N-acetyltransferase [Paenibacillus etheri]|uniref:GNAT family N-acetyltransferase n=1 Tax=Paenibacillus etheri TaxID=1306852 RepID=UPI000AC589B8|nr:GNAT family N-acetyltransferase [Paenibacillus etheri]